MSVESRANGQVWWRRHREESLARDGIDAVSGVPEAVATPVARGRPVCARCRRPISVCYCAHLPELATRTRVVVLQHPRERRVGIGTARMAHLALPNSVLRVGLDFARDPVVVAALARPQPAYLLFPRPGAVAVAELPRSGSITLVVLDGTWAQARKLLHRNPALAALPGIALSPRRPSGYRIRRQPAPFCVSTVEALAEILSALEPGGDRFDRLLAPFEAMVSRQELFQREVKSSRHRRPARPPRPAVLPARLAADWDRLVCVQGEANAWPCRHPHRQPPEIVHWLAHRPSSGASYHALLVPRRELAPGTQRHTELAPEQLGTGGTVEDWRRSWAAFAGPDDVLVQWGTYHGNLAAADGLALCESRLDLRQLLSQMLRKRLGTVETCAAALASPWPALGQPGRGGRRLAALVGLVQWVAAGGGVAGARQGEKAGLLIAPARSIVPP
jgi:DTW domain-containing protein